jgi:hypothetical protein
MKDPSPENEKAAFEGLLQGVDDIAQFFSYSRDLQRTLPELLLILTRDGDTRASLAEQQALAKQLAGK